MDNDQFIERVKSVLETQFAALSPTISEEKKFAGRGAYLTAEVSGLLLLFTLEYGIDFVLEVASPSTPRERHYVPEVLQLIGGEPYRQGVPSVAKSFAELTRLCDHLVANFEEVRALFESERAAETTGRLQSLRAMRPLLELAEQNRAAKKN